MSFLLFLPGPVFLAFAAFWICSQTFLPKLLLRNCRAVITSNLCPVHNACLHRMGPIFLSRQAVFNLPPWFIGFVTPPPPPSYIESATIEAKGWLGHIAIYWYFLKGELSQFPVLETFEEITKNIPMIYNSNFSLWNFFKKYNRKYLYWLYSKSIFSIMP